MGLIFGVLWTLGMMILCFYLKPFVGSSAVEALQAIADSRLARVRSEHPGPVFGLAMTVVMYLAGRK
ncbi:MAG: hypothetical protein ACLTZI_01375 [[Eubacterium] siraeum]